MDLAGALREIADDILLNVVEEDDSDVGSLNDESASTECATGALPLIYFMVDLEGRVTRWNKRTNEILGYADREMLPMEFIEWFAEEEVPNVAKTFEEVLKKEHGKLDTVVITKGGRPIRLKLTGTLLKDCKGNPMGIIVIGRDVTNSKKT